MNDQNEHIENNNQDDHVNTAHILPIAFISYTILIVWWVDYVNTSSYILDPYNWAKALICFIIPVICILSDTLNKSNPSKEIRTLGYILFLVNLLSINLFLVGVIIAPFFFLILGIGFSKQHWGKIVGKLALPAFIIFPILFIALPQVLGARRSDWEGRCYLTLKELGNAENAYADANEGVYASWNELRKFGYIQDGYNRKNFVDNYSLIVFDVTNPLKSKEVKNKITPTYTIVAIPRSTHNKLRTFSICDDQIPHLWVGEPSRWTTEDVSLHDITLWKPLR